MQTIAALDEHLLNLMRIDRAGEGGTARGPADRLVEVTERIEEKTALIRRDCVPWQIARATVATTIVEATAAARCYHPPSFISAVLNRQEKDPRYIARAVEFLTHVVDYVSQHQPGDYTTIERAEDRLSRLSSVVKDTITERVMKALGALPRSRGSGGGAEGRRGGGPATYTNINIADLVFPMQQRQTQPSVPQQSAFLNTPRGISERVGASPSVALLGGALTAASSSAVVFPHLSTLESIGDLCKKAHIAFEDMAEEMFSNTIPNVILAKIRSILDPCFDARYYEEYEPWVLSLQQQAQHQHNAKKGRGNQQQSDDPNAIMNLPPSYITKDINDVTSTEIFELKEKSAADGGGGKKGGGRGGSVAGGAMGHRRHYRKGEHGLLKVSEMARYLVLEVSEVLEKFLIAPLGDDPLVVELPDKIASAVFRGIMKHAKQCIYVAERLTEANPTVVFIATGGGGPGLASMYGARNLRDAIFIGLDLLEELWQWRNHVATNLRGTHYDFDDLVEEELQSYCSTVLAMLNHYRSSKGVLDEAILLQDDAMRANGRMAGVTSSLEGFTTENATGFGGSHGRRSWFPSPDCSTHEMTMNLVYMLRTLFVDYFGSLKLVLSDGGNVESSDPTTALEEVRQFVEDCVEGHIHDIGVVGDAAALLQHHDMEKLKPDAARLASNARKMAKMMLGSGSSSSKNDLTSPAPDGKSKGKDAAVSAAKALGSRASGSGKMDVHINPPVFALNNLYYLSQNLQQGYFTRRTHVVIKTVEVASSASGGGGGGATSSGANKAQKVLGGGLGDISSTWSKLVAKQRQNEKKAAEEGTKTAANPSKASEHAKSPRDKGGKHQKKQKTDAGDDEEEEEGEEDDEEAEEEEDEEAAEEEEEEEEEDAPPPTAAPNAATALVSRKRTQRVKVALLEDLVERVKGRSTGWVLAYRQCWLDVFPPFENRDEAPEEIYRIYTATSTAPFTTQQKEAIKLHFQLLCCRLSDAVNDAMVHIMADPMLKTILIAHATAAVKEGFDTLERGLIKGRPWTVDVNKYLGRPPSEWAAAVRGIL